MPELVDRAGGTDVLGKAGEHSGGLTIEQLTAADPDVIPIVPCGFDIERSCREGRPGTDLTPTRPPVFEPRRWPRRRALALRSSTKRSTRIPRRPPARGAAATERTSRILAGHARTAAANRSATRAAAPSAPRPGSLLRLPTRTVPTRFRPALSADPSVVRPPWTPQSELPTPPRACSSPISHPATACVSSASLLPSLVGVRSNPPPSGPRWTPSLAPSGG